MRRYSRMLEYIQTDARTHTTINPPILACKGKSKGKGRPRTHESLGRVNVLLYSFLNLGARWEWMVNATPRPLYHQEIPCTHCLGDWVGPGPVWTGAENLATIHTRA
jgi:hypothetical protein